MKEIISLLGAIALTPWVVQETARLGHWLGADFWWFGATIMHALIIFLLLLGAITRALDVLQAYPPLTPFILLFALIAAS